jgi:P-type Mg2+ transporter
MTVTTAGSAAATRAWLPVAEAVVATYLVLVELAKRHLFHPDDIRRPEAARATTHPHRVRRRAARFSAAGRPGSAWLRAMLTRPHAGAAGR